MQKEIELVVLPEVAAKVELYTKAAAKALKIKPESITDVEIIRRSIDARQRIVKINLTVRVYVDENKPENTLEFVLPNVADAEKVIIVGAGPAGLFAALELIKQGKKPVIFERGKMVSERKKDVANIQRNKGVDPNSNYSFGEGGAGTFSDGKLYTRSKKRGNVKEVLEILRFHGADESILIDAHPHIGTNMLPRIIIQIRESILNAGGEIYFEKRLTDFIVEDNEIKGIVDQDGASHSANYVILATGHSARDIYRLLHKKGILIEQKDFALGVRVEHPQGLIDAIQYHCDIRSEYLPAASYNLVSQVEGRGVYSFCMCPGGFIVPAATSSDEIVVNGMSPSRRNSYFANSGMVVEVKNEDLTDYQQFGALAGLEFQSAIERMAFQNGGGNQVAPAQRLHDFVNGRVSGALPETSYHPGVVSSPLHFWLPEFIVKRLREGFRVFGKKMPGYLTNEAIIIGVESRTSSPVRIPRNSDTLQHPQIKGLFPAGEGAGYAGGIVSSAVDGQRVARALVFGTSRDQ